MTRNNTSSSGTCRFGPRRGYLQKGLRSSSKSKLSKGQIRWL